MSGNKTKEPTALLEALRNRRQRSEHGSALMLVPACFLIIVMLTLLTLNSALTFLAVQQLERAASSAANDGVSALARDQFYDGGSYVIGASGADNLGNNAKTPRTDGLRGPLVVRVEAISPTRVRATARGKARALFSKLLPWSDRTLSKSVEAEVVTP